MTSRQTPSSVVGNGKFADAAGLYDELLPGRPRTIDIATGAVFTECKPRHRHQEFLSFLRRLDACIPRDLDVHLIVDNYATHKHARVRN